MVTHSGPLRVCGMPSDWHNPCIGMPAVEATLRHTRLFHSSQQLGETAMASCHPNVGDASACCDYEAATPCQDMMILVRWASPHYEAAECRVCRSFGVFGTHHVRCCLRKSSPLGSGDLMPPCYALRAHTRGLECVGSTLPNPMWACGLQLCALCALCVVGTDCPVIFNSARYTNLLKWSEQGIDQHVKAPHRPLRTSTLLATGHLNMFSDVSLIDLISWLANPPSPLAAIKGPR